ncbi:histidine phosphatase family protein [Telmatospirillum sp.]|uniref:histidine phosphatase family protein n=1 Tax=Telmatospirillum sp. TaxID=2079197 RepID=UPI00284ACC58|nr:histidine phosphatase family protein [Telmatospirillum sp.]MDR3438620.1 histidine phosphatase family protein [Telmatospirillum sp.]
MSIYLVRHGESAANCESLLSGVTDHPLTDRGRLQARAAGAQLRGIAFHRVFTSKLSRAMETCDLLLAASGATVPRIERFEELNERNFGRLEGARYEPPETLSEDDPRRRTFLDIDFRPPDGESVRDTHERAWAFFQSTLLPAATDKDILVVSHGNVLRALIAHWLEWPIDLSRNLSLSNCQVTRLRTDEISR